MSVCLCVLVLTMNVFKYIIVCCEEVVDLLVVMQVINNWMPQRHCASSERYLFCEVLTVLIDSGTNPCMQE